LYSNHHEKVIACFYFWNTWFLYNFLILSFLSLKCISLTFHQEERKEFFFRVSANFIFPETDFHLYLSMQPGVYYKLPWLPSDIFTFLLLSSLFTDIGCESPLDLASTGGWVMNGNLDPLLPAVMGGYKLNGCSLTLTRPNPTRANFWTTVNKRPTRLWSGYFLTRPKEIFSNRWEKD